MMSRGTAVDGDDLVADTSPARSAADPGATAATVGNDMLSALFKATGRPLTSHPSGCQAATPVAWTP
jgi:hypothetical protein